MAKICKQCGVKYSNSATKCVMCGTEFEDNQTYLQKKQYIRFGVILAVLAAVIVVLVLSFTGPKAAVRRIMANYKRNDVAAVVVAFPRFFMESDALDRQEFVEFIEENVKDLSEYLISYNIEKAETPTSQYRKELMDQILFFAGPGFDESDIEDIKIVWVNYKGNISGIMQSNASRFTMIKYKGDWYWWPDNINR